MLGEIAAISAAMTWAVASLIFERVGRQLGGLAMNLIKCVIGLTLMGATLWLLEGTPWPTWIDGRSAWILALSGLIGLSIGDTAWFGSLLRLGARRALLLFTLAPPITAALGFFILGEPLGTAGLVGIAITLVGVAAVITEREGPTDRRTGSSDGAAGARRSFWTMGLDRATLGGVALGVVAAACQALGSVLTKAAGADSWALAVSVVRLAAGVFGLAVVVGGLRRLDRVLIPFRDGRVAAGVFAATFLGTYLGVWLMNAGFLMTNVGVAATLNSTSPIFVLPIAWVLGDRRMSLRAIVGALFAVAGVAILFLSPSPASQ